MYGTPFPSVGSYAAWSRIQYRDWLILDSHDINKLNYLFLPVRVEESSGKVLEAEKRLQEERRRCVILEQQLEKLQMDPGRNTSALKPALRNKTGEVEHLSTAMSPIPLLWLIDSNNIWTLIYQTYTRAWPYTQPFGPTQTSGPTQKVKFWPHLIPRGFFHRFQWGQEFCNTLFSWEDSLQKKLDIALCCHHGHCCAPFALLPERFIWRLRAELKDASQFKVCQCLWKTIAGDEVIRSVVIYYPMNMIISCYKYESLTSIVKGEEFMVDVKFLFPWSDPFIA